MPNSRLYRIFKELKEAYLSKEITSCEFNLAWEAVLVAFKEKELKIKTIAMLDEQWRD
jgi:hypothetical protein